MSDNSVATKALIAAGLLAAGVASYAGYQYVKEKKGLSKSCGACCSANGVKGNKAESQISGVHKVEEDVFKGFPVFDLARYLEVSDEKEIDTDVLQQCKEISDCLHKYGILIVKDPRVSEEDNDRFINQMEKYFEQSPEALAADARPNEFYQVGVTPNGVERARDHCSFVASMPPEQKPFTECPPGPDPKWRFFWRMGERPKATKFPLLAAPPVIPAAFPEWPDVMNTWGTKMLNAVHTVAEMSALGFGLPKDQFTQLFKYGPHLLAPTGSDLAKYGKLGTVFANFHYDLNFLTIHGRSRFPGLYVWTREGKKILVKVPPKCLLLQAGKQFEWMTGGHVLAGFHEVVVVPETIAAIEKARQEKRSLWRISSTLFGHVASDKYLMPLPQFATKEAQAKYPMTFAGDQVQSELKAIKLAKGEIAAA